MDEAIGPIIIVFLVVAVVIAVVMALLYAGLFVIAAIAVIGAISGFIVAAKNFFEVLAEAHSKVPGAPGGHKWVEKAFVAF